MAKILLVEDDSHMSSVIEMWLKNELHTIDCVAKGKDAADLLKSFEFDAVILDLGLPDIGGIAVLKEFRARGGQTPILILTGKDSIDEKEQGLDAGADDYLTKPFHVKELLARIRALLRRPPVSSGNILKAGRISLDAEKHKVFKDGEPLHLFPENLLCLSFSCATRVQCSAKTRSSIGSGKLKQMLIRKRCAHRLDDYASK